MLGFGYNGDIRIAAILNSQNDILGLSEAAIYILKSHTDSNTMHADIATNYYSLYMLCALNALCTPRSFNCPLEN